MFWFLLYVFLELVLVFVLVLDHLLVLDLILALVPVSVLSLNLVINLALYPIPFLLPKTICPRVQREAVDQPP